MIHVFYNGYDIDDSNIWCGRIIQVGCDNIHRYVDPCEVLRECFENYDRGVTNTCVQEFFNTDIFSTPVWHVLTVGADGCISAVNPNTIFNDTDVLVAVDDEDNGWYLFDKLKVCIDSDISITKKWPIGSKYLELCYVWYKNFIDLDDTPDNYWNDNPYQYIKVSPSNKVYYSDEKPYLCERTMDSEKIFLHNYTSPGWPQNSKYFFQNIWFTGYNTNDTTMVFTTNWYHWIRIPKTWRYKLYMNYSADVYHGIESFRYFIRKLTATSTSSTNTILLDMDIWEANRSLAFPQSVYDWSIAELENKIQCSGWKNRIVWLEDNEYIMPGIRISTNTNGWPEWNGNPRVVFKSLPTEFWAITEPPFAAIPNSTLLNDQGSISNFGVEYIPNSEHDEYTS